MEPEEELEQDLFAGLKLKDILKGDLFPLLLKVLLSSIIVMTLYEVCKSTILTKFNQVTTNIITIIFVSTLITAIFYVVIKCYRSSWSNLSSEIKKYSQELKGEKNRFLTYFQAAPYGIILTDEKGNFLRVNQTALDITGYSRKELLNLSIFDLYSVKSESKVKELLGKVKKEGQLNQEVLFNTNQGQEIWFDLKMVKLSSIHFLGFIENINDRKEMMKNIKRKNRAIQESKTAFGFSDAEGHIREVNRSFLEMWGYESYSDIVGKHFFTLYPEESIEQMKKSVEYIKENDSWQGEVTARKADGSSFTVYLSATTIKDEDEEIEGMMASFIDITARKEMEKDLRAKKNDLYSNYEELRALNEDLRVTKEELTKTNEKLNQQIEGAKELHNQLLTWQFPHFDGVFMDGLYQPAEEIGGDFYYTVELEEQILFYLADITGHGIDGAFLNVFLRETITNYLFYSHHAGDELSPADIGEFIMDKYRSEGFSAQYFISLLLFVMDKETKQVKYINFGFQIPPLLVSPDQICELALTELPISTAIEKEIYEFVEDDFTLEVNNKLIATTDGLVEEVVEDEKYGLGRLKEVIKENINYPAELLLQAINEDFTDFIDSYSHQDDISILAVNRAEVIDKLELQIASDYKLLDKVKERFITFVTDYYEEVDMLAIGFHEMVMNAIEHGNHNQVNLEVKIIVVITPNYIKLIIKDKGQGFNWQRELTDSLDLDDLSASGRGMTITKKIWDKIFYNVKGNKVILYQERA